MKTSLGLIVILAMVVCFGCSGDSGDTHSTVPNPDMRGYWIANLTLSGSSNATSKGTYLAKIDTNNEKIVIDIYDPFTRQVALTMSCTQVMDECSFPGGTKSTTLGTVVEYPGKLVVNNQIISGVNMFTVTQSGNISNHTLSLYFTKIDTTQLAQPIVSPYISPNTTNTGAPHVDTPDYTQLYQGSMPNNDVSICQSLGNCTYSNYDCSAGTCWQTCADSTDGRCVTHSRSK